MPTGPEGERRPSDDRRRRHVGRIAAVEAVEVEPATTAAVDLGRNGGKALKQKTAARNQASGVLRVRCCR